MRYRSSKSKSMSEATGRAVIIIVIVVTSALSFTLGYFVGRAGENEKQHQTAAALPYTVETTEVKEQPVQGTTSAVPVIPQPPEKKEVASLEKNPVVPVQAVKAADEVKTKDAGSRLNVTKYTVQAGAFKSMKEAENLKRRLEKKGHKAYIKKSPTSETVRLFKVRTGEFTDKDEAEDFALKLKKSENLKTFVIAKDEERGKVKNSPGSSGLKKESVR